MYVEQKSQIVRGVQSGIIPLRIITPRLILRTLLECDLYDIIAYTTDPDVNQFMQWPSQTKSLRLGIEYQNSIIGECGLIFQTNFTEIYYVLAKKYWGNGFATEAATSLINYSYTALNIIYIEAWIVKPNKRSQRVAQRLNMQHTATLEKQWYCNGKLHDVIIYTLHKPS
jgi:ribosomal-protein-alanine N-acetyltransferase